MDQNPWMHTLGSCTSGGSADRQSQGYRVDGGHEQNVLPVNPSFVGLHPTVQHPQQHLQHQSVQPFAFSPMPATMHNQLFLQNQDHLQRGFMNAPQNTQHRVYHTDSNLPERLLSTQEVADTVVSAAAAQQQYQQQQILRMSSQQQYQQQQILRMSSQQQYHQQPILRMSSQQQYQQQPILRMSSQQQYQPQHNLRMPCQQQHQLPLPRPAQPLLPSSSMDMHIPQLFTTTWAQNAPSVMNLGHQKVSPPLEPEPEKTPTQKEMEQFAMACQQRRKELGLSQEKVITAIRKLCDCSIARSTYARFEKAELPFENMCKLKPVMQRWLETSHRNSASPSSQITTIPTVPVSYRSPIDDFYASITSSRATLPPQTPLNRPPLMHPGHPP